MSPPKKANTVTKIYDQALKYCRDDRLPPSMLRPRLYEYLAAGEYRRTGALRGLAVGRRNQRLRHPRDSHTDGRSHFEPQPQAFQPA